VGYSARKIKLEKERTKLLVHSCASAIPILYFLATYGGSETYWSLQGILLLSLGSLSVHAPLIYFVLLFYETWI